MEGEHSCTHMPTTDSGNDEQEREREDDGGVDETGDEDVGALRGLDGRVERREVAGAELVEVAGRRSYVVQIRVLVRLRRRHHSSSAAESHDCKVNSFLRLPTT